MQLFNCSRCGTIYLYPLPTEEELTKIYNNAYDGATSGYFSKVEKKVRRSRRRMRELSRLVGGGRFLDIGCNGGFMVEAAREKGFEAFGLDIDPVSIRYAEEHYPQNHFFQGTVEQFDPLAPRFELIYCSEVIEHVPKVNRFVATVVKLLKPDGVFFVTTPDISHWRRPRNVENWDGFHPPWHCIYLRPSSLRSLLESHGLEVFRTKFAWKPGIKMFCRRATSCK